MTTQDSDRPRCNLLLIEDDVLATRRIERLVGRLGDDYHLAGKARCGLDGVAMVERLRSEVLLLDIDLPDIDGFEVLSRLQFRPTVIFTSAHINCHQRALEAGASDFLYKPIELEVLRRALEKHCRTGEDKDALSTNTES